MENVNYINYISKLNEYAQRKQLKPNDVKYLDLGLDETTQLFVQRVVLKGVEYPQGVGRTKKEAKQDAAKNALKCLEDQQDTDTDDVAEASTVSGHLLRSNQNYTCWLNEYGQKNCVTIKPVESMKPGPNSTIFCCRFVAGDKEYPDATGKTRKEAKEEAAKLVYEMICGDRTTESAAENFNPASDQLDDETDPNVSDVINQTRSLSVKSQNNSVTEKNFIAFINNYCQEKELGYSFIEMGKSGPPHNPQFLCKLIINNEDYPVGVGKNKKEARQHAAQLAWSALQETSGWDSEVSFGSTFSEFSDSAPTTSTFTSLFDSIERLGEGGFGCVYKAREKLLDEVCAVKIVAYHEEALDEAKKLSKLFNEHIVRYYHCWIENSKYEEATGDRSTDSVSSESASTSPSQYLYIKMELCDTKTLRNWIDERNQRTEQDFKRREESLEIVQQVVTGVEYIHSKKLIHRDLKPANIMFGGDGAAKIGDFGLVTADDPETLLERTRSRGTPSYMAPEQKNNLTCDRKVDIFALGLIFFELFWKISTGHERLAIWMDVRHQRFPDGFTDYFFQEAQIIKLMLSEKPEERPEASSLKAEVEKWTQHYLGTVTI
ncbi:interferon-induced, double-stranded RNA-activated protein kinase-like [Betta splendens]|uniref:non-specific serine/threonine protein kinase n=1 Tax=Betta splendens TaxID=158456 RepID=A0A6P7PVE6_BETSP|nr:interferon-induced, double-stranded RNA-activated protein kinase-like [Betta splendens]